MARRRRRSRFPDRALHLRGSRRRDDKGVLHRDLKPANAMIDGRGQVLITGFGLAGMAGSVEGGEIRNGTPADIAPERLGAGRRVQPGEVFWKAKVRAIRADM